MFCVPFFPAPEEVVVERGTAADGFFPEAAGGGHAEHYYRGSPDVEGSGVVFTYSLLDG